MHSALLIKRFKANMDFFDNIRQEIFIDFQLKLRRVWLSYRRRKQRKEVYEKRLREQIDELEKAREEISRELNDLNESCPEI
jgi:hypothetical protein